MLLSSLLINWFLENKRPLPWRKEKNAYHILLSEIIMQQTRMEQGLPYFYKIAEAFPTVESLAAADEELLLRYWQGLGYYSRARNLHATAKNHNNPKKIIFCLIVDDFNSTLHLIQFGFLRLSY